MAKKKTEEINYVHRIFYAVVRKYLPTWADVDKFSKKTGISLNTMRSFYYNDGQAGISTMNTVLKELLKLNPEKVDAIVSKIESIEPVSESNQIWSSIQASEDRKKYYSLVAKALYEIDNSLEKKKNK